MQIQMQDIKIYFNAYSEKKKRKIQFLTNVWKKNEIQEAFSCGKKEKRNL